MSTEPALSDMEGYLLKKKRKKMQGMARRYFRLSSDGELSYSFRPDTPVRDSILVSLAYITASRKLKSFHVDSGSVVWHVKALTQDDFESWTMALRRCSATVVEQSGTGAGRKGSAGQEHPALVTEDAANAARIDYPKIALAVSRMAAPLADLDTVVAELRAQQEGSPVGNHSHSHSPSSHPHPSTPSSQKLRWLGGGKKPGKDTHPTPPPRSAVDDYFDAKPTNEVLVRQLSTLLANLKAQHAALSELLSSSAALQSSSSSIMLDDLPLRSWATRSAAGGSHRRTLSRASSVHSGETQDFFEDALPGEFILEEESPSDDDEHSNSSDGDDFDESESSFASLDEEQPFHHEQDVSEVDTERDADTATLLGDPDGVRRRDQLPAPISGDEFSMLGMLRKNVGKDLSTISFPVTMNEPLSALQRIAEELEYTELLDRAAAASDSAERLTLVATFATASASGSKFRTSRKPFNPLLGETYECVRPDKGFKFIAEKVSHHPPVMAFHTEAKQRGWRIDGHVAPSQKFWGRSMEVFVTGDFNVSFPGANETYAIRKPSSFVRNLVAGSKYLEIVGDLVVSDVDSGAKAVITFKEGSAWGGLSSRNKIDGKVFGIDGHIAAELVGRWDERVERKEGKDSFQRLWVVNEFPPHAAQQFYGFSHFAVELNEVTSLEDGFLAPSDSRLRPDQLTLERGDVDDAEEIKKRVEEKQREKRKAGGTHVPKWFTQDGDGWRYSGHYFEKREKKVFEDPDIF